MKKAILLLAVGLLSLSARAETREFPGSDPRITYVGRTLVEGNNVTFDWTGTVLRLRFKGKYLAIKVSDTDKDYYNLWMDHTPTAVADRVIAMHGNDSLIVLYEGAKKAGEHFLTLMKRTEGEQGKTTVHAVLTDGELLQAEGPKPRLIEIVGDSYTCGYGSESHNGSDPFTKETENQNQSYSGILGRYFDADLHVIAHSGMGVARNYADKLRDFYMPDRYLNTFDDGFDKREDTPKWTPGGQKPAITIINLGANDFSTCRQPLKHLFVENYLRLMREIKDFYGEDHPILCAGSHPNNFEYIRAAVEACGMENVACFVLWDHIFSSDEYGASFHPNYEAHRKIAHAFIPYIATLTGWGLQDKPVQ